MTIFHILHPYNYLFKRNNFHVLLSINPLNIFIWVITSKPIESIHDCEKNEIFLKIITSIQCYKLTHIMQNISDDNEAALTEDSITEN